MIFAPHAGSRAETILSQPVPDRDNLAEWTLRLAAAIDVAAAAAHSGERQGAIDALLRCPPERHPPDECDDAAVRALLVEWHATYAMLAQDVAHLSAAAARATRVLPQQPSGDRSQHRVLMALGSVVEFALHHPWAREVAGGIDADAVVQTLLAQADATSERDPTWAQQLEVRGLGLEFAASELADAVEHREVETADAEASLAERLAAAWRLVQRQVLAHASHASSWLKGVAVADDALPSGARLRPVVMFANKQRTIGSLIYSESRFELSVSPTSDGTGVRVRIVSDELGAAALPDAFRDAQVFGTTCEIVLSVDEARELGRHGGE